MSSNYANYRNYYQNQRINTHPSYQATYYNGKVVVKKPKKDHSIIKKDALGKFEKLEHKLLDYLSEFVKYSESCRIPPKKPIPYGAKGSKYTVPTVNRSASPSRGRSASPAATRAALPAHRRSASPSAPPTSKRSASQSPQRVASQIPKRSASQSPQRAAPQSPKRAASACPKPVESACPKPVESACPKPAVSAGLKSVASTDPKRAASPSPKRAAQKPTKQGEPHMAMKKYRYPSNLEKKIGQIEEKTRSIQKYNKLLEERFQKYKLSSENHGSIIMDANLKDVIIKEVKNLEEILIEKRLEDQNLNIKNIPEYEKCHGMLQECIKMLGDAIREEKEDKKKKIKEKEENLKKGKKLQQPPYEKKGKIDSKPKTVIKGKPKASIECKPKLFELKIKKPEDMSDDEFFNQYNLDISDYECYKEGGKELGKVKQETEASDENEDVAIPADDDGKAEDEAAEADDEETDDEETDDEEADDEEAAEAEDKLGPLQNFSSRLQEREDPEPEQEHPEPEPVLQPKSVRKTKSVPHPISVPRPKSVPKSESVPQPKFIETDRRKLIQIQEELRSLEYNNKKFLNVVHGLRKNLNTKDIEEQVFIPRNEFLNEVYQIREASSNIERSERNVEKLISNLKIL